jgi:uncharacterized membrane protein YgcG
MLSRLLAAIAVSLALVAVPTAAQADISDFTFDSFAADYTISQNADGTSHLEVVETIVAVFPEYDQNRGIIRAIPNYYNDVDVELEVHSVTDENGGDVYYEIDNTGEFTELPLGTDDYVHGTTTYVISYSMNNVVGDFRDTAADEFYWDVNGTGWDQPFGTVSATITVDPAVSAALTGNAACYEGAENSTQQCTISHVTDAATSTDTFSASSGGSLAPGENVSVAIGFDPGTFVQGEVAPGREPLIFTNDLPWWSVAIAILSILGAVGALVASISARLRRSALAPKAGFIVPQYSVPENLNVMTAAHLLGRPGYAVSAELVGLAVRKHIRILDYPVTAGSGAEYSLQFLTAEGADPFDLHIIHAVFGPVPLPGEVRELEPEDASLGAKVAAASTAAQKWVVDSGLHPNRSSSGCLLAFLAALPLVLAIVGQVAALGARTTNPVPLVAIVVTLGLLIATAIVSFGNRRPLSELGQRTVDYLEGMRVYLQLAEKDRFRVLQSPEGAERVDVGDTKQIIKLYEKLLPWAVMWGVEDQWVKELEVHVAAAGESPDWFVSTNNTFSAYALTSAISGVSHSSTYSPPATYSGSGGSSSFGGSMGGGFSGGGGGGGGGGGR